MLAILLADREPTFDPSSLRHVITAAFSLVGLRQGEAIKLRGVARSLKATFPWYSPQIDPALHFQ
jgi:hypothetical protein